MEISDSKESVAKSAMHFLTGTFMSRLTGLIRDLSMAFCFGVTPAVGTFLIAFRLANLMRRLFGEGALLNGFIPFFEAKRRKDPKEGAYFFRDIFWSLSIILLVLVVLLETLMIPLYFSHTLSLAISDILYLLIIQTPGLIFICLFGLTMALLQCEKNFFIPGVAPVAFNIIWIAAIWIVRNFTPINAMAGLSLAIVLAFAFQLIVTFPAVKRYIKGLISGKEWFTPLIFGKELRLIISPIFYGVIGVAAVQINSSFDILMARFISESGPALLSYANRVQQLPISLFALAISSALMPPLSRAIKNDQFDEYRSLLMYGMTRTYALLFPGMVGIFVLGLSSINLLYGRGQFTTAAVYGTTQCLWAYGLGLIPVAFILLLAPAYYSRRDYRTPMIASLISVGVNIVLNMVFIFLFHLPPISIALSTSITAYVNLWYLLKRLNIDVFYKIKKSFITVTLSSLSAGAVTAALAYFLFADPSISLLVHQPPLELMRDFGSQFTRFCTLTFIFGVSFFTFAFAFKAEDATQLLSGLFPKKEKDIN